MLQRCAEMLAMEDTGDDYCKVLKLIQMIQMAVGHAGLAGGQYRKRQDVGLGKQWAKHLRAYRERIRPEYEKKAQYEREKDEAERVKRNAKIAEQYRKAMIKNERGGRC